MQVCTSLQTDNHASTPPLCFLQAGCPSCRPTNSVKALKALLLTTSCCKLLEIPVLKHETSIIPLTVSHCHLLSCTCANCRVKQGSHRPQTLPPVLPPSTPWLQEVVPSVHCRLQQVLLCTKPMAACEPHCLSLVVTSSSLGSCANVTIYKTGNT